MKKWILSIICLSFMVASTAYPLDDSYDPIGKYKSSLETGTYLERDRWQSDRMNIKSGLKTEGYIKRDKWESDRFNFFDNTGRPSGTYLKRDRWQPERYNIKQDRLHPN
jgi:hypothetical protein